MLETFLIPANTTITAKADGQPVEITAAEQRVFLVTLKVTRVVEQEALDVTLQGSGDGKTWSPKPLLSFPQKFYPGEELLLLDLSRQADVKFVRAHWEVNRWGRGSDQPWFELELSLKEVPAHMLRERGA